MPKQSATLRDVARECGVSATAVSLVLNARDCTIPESTRDRIKQVAKAMDYRPDATARSLVMKKSNTIGVIIPDISNAFFAEAVRNIQIELNKYGYDMFLCDSEEQFENDMRYIKLLSSRNVDALILTMSAQSLTDENHLEVKHQLERANVPYVLFDRYYQGNEPKVEVDNTASGHEVARYLIECGHTEIGVITGPLNLNSSRNRLKGVQDAMTEAGLVLKSENIVTGNYDMETGREGAKKLLGRVTAVFAFNDLQAYGVLETAKVMKLTIPADVSLVGFDDIFYSSILETQLTTVRQPMREMTHQLCGLLMEIIDDPAKIREIRLPAELIKRDSVRSIRREDVR